MTGVQRVSATRAAALSAGPTPADLGQSRKSSMRQTRSPRHRPADSLRRSKTLLWIDDYEPALAVYSAIFERLGFRVIAASRPSIGLHLAASEPIDAVITDYEMPEMNGAAVAAELKSRYPHLPVILFTAATSLPSQVGKLADAWCDKAEPLEQLLAMLNRLVFKKPSQSRQPQPLRPSSELGQRTVA